MPKFRKKPVEVEAIQWDGSNESFQQILQLQETSNRKVMPHENTLGVLIIPTLEGEMMANKNDWIIKGVSGEIYPCKPDIFERTYDAVN